MSRRNLVSTRLIVVTGGLALAAGVASGIFAAEEPQIPCPAALDGAAVEEDRLDDIGRRALVLGNGDLNALLWEGGGALRMRVTKNDLWDARIDTSKDPDLLRMDIRQRKWTGGTRKPPSWHDHPYPQPRCAAVVVLGTSLPVTESWTCVRRGAQNDFGEREGLVIMSTAGDSGVSAGYRCACGIFTTVYSSLRLQLSGTPNAKYYVNVRDAGGKDLVRSGWRETPAKSEAVSLPFSAAKAPATLELYVMSTDGKRAENRCQLIAFEEDIRFGRAFPTGQHLWAGIPCDAGKIQEQELAPDRLRSLDLWIWPHRVGTAKPMAALQISAGSWVPEIGLPRTAGRRRFLCQRDRPVS